MYRPPTWDNPHAILSPPVDGPWADQVDGIIAPTPHTSLTDGITADAYVHEFAYQNPRLSPALDYRSDYRQQIPYNLEDYQAGNSCAQDKHPRQWTVPQGPQTGDDPRNVEVPPSDSARDRPDGLGPGPPRIADNGSEGSASSQDTMILKPDVEDAEMLEAPGTCSEPWTYTRTNEVASSRRRSLLRQRPALDDDEGSKTKVSKRVSFHDEVMTFGEQRIAPLEDMDDGYESTDNLSSETTSSSSSTNARLVKELRERNMAALVPSVDRPHRTLMSTFSDMNIALRRTIFKRTTAKPKKCDVEDKLKELCLSHESLDDQCTEAGFVKAPVTVTQHSPIREVIDVHASQDSGAMYNTGTGLAGSDSVNSLCSSFSDSLHSDRPVYQQGRVLYTGAVVPDTDLNPDAMLYNDTVVHYGDADIVHYTRPAVDDPLLHVSSAALHQSRGESSSERQPATSGAAGPHDPVFRGGGYTAPVAGGKSIHADQYMPSDLHNNHHHRTRSTPAEHARQHAPAIAATLDWRASPPPPSPPARLPRSRTADELLLHSTADSASSEAGGCSPSTGRKRRPCEILRNDSFRKSMECMYSSGMEVQATHVTPEYAQYNTGGYSSQDKYGSLRRSRSPVNSLSPANSLSDSQVLRDALSPKDPHGIAAYAKKQQRHSLGHHRSSPKITVPLDTLRPHPKRSAPVLVTSDQSQAGSEERRVSPKERRRSAPVKADHSIVPRQMASPLRDAHAAGSAIVVERSTSSSPSSWTVEHRGSTLDDDLHLDLNIDERHKKWLLEQRENVEPFTKGLIPPPKPSRYSADMLSSSLPEDMLTRSLPTTPTDDAERFSLSTRSGSLLLEQHRRQLGDEQSRYKQLLDKCQAGLLNNHPDAGHSRPHAMDLSETYPSRERWAAPVDGTRSRSPAHQVWAPAHNLIHRTASLGERRGVSTTMDSHVAPLHHFESQAPADLSPPSSAKHFSLNV